MLIRSLMLFLLLFAPGVLSLASQTDSPAASPSATIVPVVDFELNWKAVDPEWYQVSIDSNGKVSYESRSQRKEGEEANDPFKMDFTATQETTKKVFEFAKAANYFQGDFELKGKNLAQTGTKTLRYDDGRTKGATSYNQSMNGAVSNLTSMFQAISATMESGRKLAFSLRFDKLGVDAQLKRMEDMKKSGMMIEVQALEPLLTKIIQDKSFMNVSRQRAQRLLGLPVAPAGSR